MLVAGAAQVRNDAIPVGEPGAGAGLFELKFDTLRRERYRAITGRDALQSVLDGLEAAREAGLAPVKLDAVQLPETQDEEIFEIAEFARRRNFVLRFIEAMPVGASGRTAGFRPLTQLLAQLRERYGLVDGVVPGGGPARYLVAPDGGFSLGFITAVSQHFCAACNRVRLTADGKLLLCLGAEGDIDLRRDLRAGRSAADLAARIREALRAKPRMHAFATTPRGVARVMLQVGG